MYMFTNSDTEDDAFPSLTRPPKQDVDIVSFKISRSIRFVAVSSVVGVGLI